jgi:hypothetical protein
MCVFFAHAMKNICYHKILYEHLEIEDDAVD